MCVCVFALGIHWLGPSQHRRCNAIKADNEAIRPWNHTRTAPCAHWLAWQIRGMTYSVRCVTLMCIFHTEWDGRKSIDFHRRTVGGSSCVSVCARVCVIQIKQHILASMYFALGGFPWLCHMLHVSKKGRGWTLCKTPSPFHPLSLPPSLTRSPFACIPFPGDAPHPACLSPPIIEPNGLGG